MRLKLHTYRVRFVLANGTPREYTAYAFNKDEAHALAMKMFRAMHPEEAKTALDYGATRID